MGSVADVSATFFLEATQSDDVSTRRIKGRTYLCGFGIIPTYKIDSTTTLVTGTVKLENLTAAGDASSEEVLMEFPVIVGSAYAVATFCSFSDDDGGILFENGIYVNDTDDVLGNENFALVLFFSGSSEGGTSA